MTQPQQPPALGGLVATLVAADAGTHITEATVATVSLNAAATFASITARTKQALTSMWLPVNPYDGRQVSAFVDRANPILIAAQRATAQTAAAAQSAMLKPMGIAVAVTPKLPDDIRVPHAQRAVVSYVEPGAEPNADVTVTRSNATNASLLERPARTLRWQESTGASSDRAREASITRLDDIVDGNLVIAQRDAEHQVLNDKGTKYTRTGAAITGYRRIIHPEFSAGGVCGLCVAASHRVYRVETLRPIHLRCKCTSAPVTATYDPGQSLNAADFKLLYTDAGSAGGRGASSTKSADLKKTRYAVTDSELGPILVPFAGEPVQQFLTAA